jgi:hypothetical protein
MATEIQQHAAEHGVAIGSNLYGYVAEFQTPEELITAARLAREAGYTKMDAFSPMPVEGLSEAIGYRNKQMPFLMLMGALTGGTVAFIGQWYANSWSYPLNIGGRPYFSWPMFIVPTFEMTILFCALTGVFGMILLNGLPQPYHSIFNTPGFERASSDRFFLAIEAQDPKFDAQGTRQFMNGLSAVQVSAVEK